MSNVARVASIAANIPEVEPRVAFVYKEVLISASGSGSFDISSVVRPNDLAIVAQSSGESSNVSTSMGVDTFTPFLSQYANDSYDTSLRLSYKHLGSTPLTTLTLIGNQARVNTLYLFRAVGQASLSTSTPNSDYSIILNSGSSVPPSLTLNGNPRQSLILVGGAANFYPEAHYNEPSYLENTIYGTDAKTVVNSRNTAQFAGTWPQGQVPYSPTTVSASRGLNPDNTAITYSVEIELA